MRRLSIEPFHGLRSTTPGAAATAPSAGRGILRKNRRRQEQRREHESFHGNPHVG